MSAPKGEAVKPRPQSGKRNVTGAWLVYEHDPGAPLVPLVTSLHPDELEARRAAMDGAEGSRVVFVRWGEVLKDALGR